MPLFVGLAEVAVTLPFVTSLLFADRVFITIKTIMNLTIRQLNFGARAFLGGLYSGKIGFRFAN